MNQETNAVKKIDDMHELIGDLVDYVERFADSNGEPSDGNCREIIRKAECWLEAGSMTLDPFDLVSGLAVYAERFADANDEPADGDCRKVLARAAGIAASRPGVTPAPVVARFRADGNMNEAVAKMRKLIEQQSPETRSGLESAFNNVLIAYEAVRDQLYSDWRAAKAQAAQLPETKQTVDGHPAGGTWETRTIALPSFEIVVSSDGQGSGTVTSTLDEEAGPDGIEFLGVKLLVLGHARAGVDILSPGYIAGLDLGVEHIRNRLQEIAESSDEL
ncbi:hypothetical protein [Paraburkholderia sp. SIMBA_054]|uniref:hypothetical protein n=1 Tax=Paraburkholderia sp. SIMBA_054 TaxID=3085795 RepID=UPI00397D13E5